MSRTISPNDLKGLLDTSKNLTVLDVRRKQDYDTDTLRLPGAQWRDPDKLAEWGDGLSKDKEIVLYCMRGGSVSNSVLDALVTRGLKARYIEGGIEAWKVSGGQTVTK